jgi:hypothetical protein
MANEMLRRITLRTIELTQKVVRAEAYKNGNAQVTPLAKIAGTTTQAKTGQTEKGQYTALLGDFVAINLLTGAMYTSGKCILPNFISEQLASALALSQTVDFALEIGVKQDDDSATGYIYTVKSLRDAAPTDKMKELMASAGMVQNDNKAQGVLELQGQGAESPGEADAALSVNAEKEIAEKANSVAAKKAALKNNK